MKDRKAHCLQYYRRSFSKKIKEEAKAFIESRKEDLILLDRPEANGVDVFGTCRNIGLLLDRNPHRIFWKIVLIGKKVNTVQLENNKLD